MPGSRKLPTRDELRVWREFIETTEVLRTLLAARLLGDTGLSTGDYTVLLALSEAEGVAEGVAESARENGAGRGAEGARLRSSELARAVGWERSRLSHHLGRMERRGLIRREECATDSRGADVVLEPGGADAFRAATYPHLRAVRELFVDALTPELLAGAGGIAAALREHLDVPGAAHPGDR